MAVIVFITGCSQNLEGQNGCTQEKGLQKLDSIFRNEKTVR